VLDDVHYPYSTAGAPHVTPAGALDGRGRRLRPGRSPYDVLGPLPTADGRPPLLMIAQPMDAGGFVTLASQFPDRTVVTYDPRGLGRSTRRDGRVDHSPTVQADDLHAVIEALGAGPVEMFASSGGGVTALALVAAHPDDVITLVAHEPPLIPVLPTPRRPSAPAPASATPTRRTAGAPAWRPSSR
jgi:pimeloyl-ACP methyl ester carboxylesterase